MSNWIDRVTQGKVVDIGAGPVRTCNSTRWLIDRACARPARIILACAEGIDNRVVAWRLRMSEVTVCKWRGRFIRERLDGLCDEPPPGSPRRVTEAQVETRSLASGAERSRHVFASPAGLDSVDQRPLGIPVSRPGFTARAAIITGKPASRRSSVFDGFPTPSPIASVGISSRANPCKKATAANTFP